LFMVATPYMQHSNSASTSHSHASNQHPAAPERKREKIMHQIKKEHHRSQQLLLTDLNQEANQKKRN
jgi:hypothetical protein